MSGIITSPSRGFNFDEYEVHSERSFLTWKFNSTNHIQTSDVKYGQGIILGLTIPYDEYDRTNHVKTIKLNNERGTITLNIGEYYQHTVILNSDKWQHSSDYTLNFGVDSKNNYARFSSKGYGSAGVLKYDCDNYTTYTLTEILYRLGCVENKPIFKFNNWVQIEMVWDDTISSNQSIDTLFYYRPIN